MEASFAALATPVSVPALDKSGGPSIIVRDTVNHMNLRISARALAYFRDGGIIRKEIRIGKESRMIGMRLYEDGIDVPRLVECEIPKVDHVVTDQPAESAAAA